MPISGTVRDLMVPLDNFPHVSGNASLREAFAKLHAVSGSSELFRNILVLDDKDRLLGTLGLKNVLHALLPDYLRHGSTHFQGTNQDITALSVLWQEDCAEQCRQAGKIRARDHVSPVKATIGSDEPLSKAAFLFATTPVNVLPVVAGKELVGVLRLVDVFDEVVIEVLSERCDT
jgi:CBS-domain-containing membrane protein